MLGPRPRPPLAPVGSAPDQDWATSDDFTKFERNADTVLSPGWKQPSAASAGFRTLEYRPEREGVPRLQTLDYRPERDGVGAAVPLLQRVALPTPAPNKAAAEAIAARAKLFEDWDKNPQKEIDANRFLRERIFGAKPDKNNILQDPFGMYDSVFSKAMRKGLQNATPEELQAMQRLKPRNPIEAARAALPGGRINLTPQQRQQFVSMIERGGPDGEKIGSAARKYWGLEMRK